MFLKILLLSVVIIGIAFAGFAVKMFFKKEGEFEKSCSSVDPKTGQRIGCMCGGEGGEFCKNKETDEDSHIKVQPLHID